MNNWADRSGEVFIKTKIVPADDKEILEYGISQGLFLVFNLLIFFGICCYFKIIIWGFIFLVLFWPLRIYAGGYHAKTRMHCILISTFMEIVRACTIRLLDLETARHEEVAIYEVNQRIPNGWRIAGAKRSNP